MICKRPYLSAKYYVWPSNRLWCCSVVNERCEYIYGEYGHIDRASCESAIEAWLERYRDPWLRSEGKK